MLRLEIQRLTYIIIVLNELSIIGEYKQGESYVEKYYNGSIYRKLKEPKNEKEIFCYARRKGRKGLQKRYDVSIQIRWVTRTFWVREERKCETEWMREFLAHSGILSSSIWLIHKINFFRMTKGQVDNGHITTVPLCHVKDLKFRSITC